MKDDKPESTVPYYSRSNPACSICGKPSAYEIFGPGNVRYGYGCTANHAHKRAKQLAEIDRKSVAVKERET